ncbi:hypothetical protein H311_02958 [Anncaliia algerae PRA109]|nr:hypothetical protein H311_02958 [Anncaliia algerae PRA109]
MDVRKKYINEFQNCHKCSNEQMRIKFKDELYFFKCTKCDSTKSIFYNTIFYNKKKNLLKYWILYIFGL